MDWTIGALNHWTIFWTFFWTIFLDDFGPFYRWGGRPLVLRERWDVEYQYAGRGGRLMHL